MSHSLIANMTLFVIISDFLKCITTFGMIFSIVLWSVGDDGFLHFNKQEKDNIIEYTNKGKVLRVYIPICKRAILLSVLMMIATCLHL